MPQSLAELRAANKAEEAAAAKKEEKTEEKQGEAAETKAAEADEKQEEQQDDTKADDKSEEGEKKDDEPTDDAWLKADEGEPDDPKFTSHDVANVRRKYKAEAKQAKEEASEVKAKLEKVEQELQALKTNKQTLVPAAGKPKRADFKTDEEFVEALTDYKIGITTQQAQSEYAANERKRQIDDRNAKTAVAVNQHYERAAKLSEKSGIKPEAYKAADQKVREAIDSIFPSTGDAVADALISSLGSGSEKVFYHIGVNSAKRAELVKLLTEDRSGIRAAVFLGKLNTELTTPAKRETKAPDPIDDVKGDKAGSSDGANKLKRQYKEAHDKGDAQAAFNIRRKAQKQGISTMGW